jgi:hypothetical protein
MDYERAIKWATKNWLAVKGYQTKMTDRRGYGGSVVSLPFGEAKWENPLLVWVWMSFVDEGYGGWGTCLGLSEDGKIYWAYQSHCSCNSFEDSKEMDEVPENTEKVFELNSVPDDWKSRVASNIAALRDEIKKTDR